jgi:hypothetical protein
VIDPYTLLHAAIPIVVLHGRPPVTPVPHWAVLLVVVPCLWALVGGGVLAVDRLLRRLESEGR